MTALSAHEIGEMWLRDRARELRAAARRAQRAYTKGAIYREAMRLASACDLAAEVFERALSQAKAEHRKARAEPEQPVSDATGGNEP